MTKNINESIPEMRDIFITLLEENRQALFASIERAIARSEPSSEDSILKAMRVLVDEVGYLKTERVFNNLLAERSSSDQAFWRLRGAGFQSLARRTVPAALDIDLSAYFTGSGWHAAEWLAEWNHGQRWSDGTTGWIEVALRRDVNLLIEWECVKCYGPDVDVRIIFDGVEIIPEVDYRRGRIFFRSKLQATARSYSQRAIIGIRSGIAVTPSEIDIESGDSRNLGICACFFRAYPAEVEAK